MSGGEVPAWAAVPAALLLIVGGLLSVIGALGLLRLKDFFARMHPPTMTATLSTGCVLIASMLVASGIAARPVFHEILISVFVVLSAPVTAMILARAALARRRPEGGSTDGH